MTEPPRLLVSVRNATEALDALAGGADWIDLKEPSAGPLGAVDAITAAEAVARVAGQAPVSAAAGELCDWFDSPQRDLLNVSGISLLKLGLAACAETDWRPRWQRAAREVAAAGKSLVAVIYADAHAAGSPSPNAVLAAAAAAYCPWVLWDTFDKSLGPLLEHTSSAALAVQLRQARAAGLRTVVAGRLTEDALLRLPLELIDIIAVRGAVCRDSRQSAVCRERVCALARAIVAARRLLGPLATIG
jgi:(5-formylfuran-3-yl)methyl phosphate synthase